jgi:cAMP and cAMP-inhibited cGMP 3',5'-cyclic phosphodiesterase 10
MDKGIAGHVATTGTAMNIPDAYENTLFNQAIDKKTGYRTRAILCMPIKSNDQVIGVIQLINKVDGSNVFSPDDEDIMMIFLAIAGPILAVSNLYSQIQGKGDKEKGTGASQEVPGHVSTSSKDNKLSKRHLSGFAETEEDEEEA